MQEDIMNSRVLGLHNLDTWRILLQSLTEILRCTKTSNENDCLIIVSEGQLALVLGVHALVSFPVCFTLSR